MILVTGACSSGKRTFVRSLGYEWDAMVDARDCLWEDARVVYNAQELVRNPEADLELLFDCLKNKQVVVCTEVGCGIVPLERADRVWREHAGRLSCMLADEANAVVRMVCGIAVTLKGDASL